MNIAFWGEERESGTTTHMHAVAEVMSVLCPKEELTYGGMLHGADQGIHFFDCGSGLNDRKRRVLWHADLVVVNLRRERRCVERFFMQDFHVSRNLTYLLGGCERGDGADRRYLERVFRVEPEHIGEVPFCNGFYHALQRNLGADFLQREMWSPGSCESEQLVREFARVARMIQRQTEEVRAKCAKAASAEKQRKQKEKQKEKKKSR